MKKLVLVVVLLSVCPAFSAASDEVAVALRATELLRGQMRDPDSLVIEHVYVKLDHKPDHPLMCIPYRSRNGFGGYTHNVAEYKGGNDFSMGFRCAGIERNLDKALQKGWADITDEYRKAAAEKR